MIYVMMALYQEAHGLIRELELKKNTAYAPFEVFDNESAGIRLVVTGVGEIAAAAATAAVCARDGADAADFLVNIGCCAAANAGVDRGCKPADRGMDSCCASGRTPARTAAVNWQTVDMDSGYGAGKRRPDRRPVRVSQDHGAGDRKNVLSGYSVPAPVEGTRTCDRDAAVTKSSGTRSFI